MRKGVPTQTFCKNFPNKTKKKNALEKKNISKYINK